MDEPGRDSSSAPYLYRPPSGPGAMYDHSDFLPSHAPSSYNYVPDFPSNQYGTRLPAVPHHDDSVSHNSLTPLRIPSLAETVANAQGLPYSASRHGSQATLTGSGASAHSPPAYWDPRHARTDASRSGASTWPVLPALDTVSIPHRSAQSGQISPQLPHRPWSSSASSATSSSSGGGASGSHYAGSPFPTLTSPFYPAQSPPSQRTAEAVSPSASSHPSNSPEYFSRSSYTTAPPNPPPPGSGYLHSASHWSTQYPRSGNEAQQQQQQQRSLPALQPITTYSLSSTNSSSPPPSSSGTQSSQMAYWERSRYEGR